MVFEQNVHVIVCLTAVSPNRASRSQKAEQYWPPAGETDFLDQSDLCVRNVDSVDSEDQVAYRHFEIWNPLDTEDGARRHNVLLVHYQGWPDHGVPSKTTDLRDILYRIRAWKADQQQTSGTTDFGPMVVHCSAGCGRTGTFCVVDTVLSVLEYTRYPHMAAPSPSGHTMPVSSQQGTGDAVYDWRSDRDIIFESLTSFREERMLMVQTAAQYSFCYTVARDLCR
ncbi:hypothetical protein BGZ99_001822 [Dissophora globulifera]|uniref:Protein tyrosine phosphatase n=1 Tax=Dissophora globulifera TaxID=979702 RepID=A0A9P6RT45_9FUNG|nr:hypothetical protein BGZ99_001822 [Dissophora globulifera]